MDPRVALLKALSTHFVEGTVKVEAEHFGFPFLEWLLSEGGTLEYGELTDTRLLHKYKIAGISEQRLDQFLQLHVLKQFNVCRYFSAEKNDVLCFNMDNNHKLDNLEIIPEMCVARDTLTALLARLGCVPLIIASGRGYHLWLRLDQPLENGILYEFMVAAAARALLPLMERAENHRAVKFSFYPDVNIVEDVSLRLFGSDHAKTKAFSRVYTPDGLLDEGASWNAFERFVRGQPTPVAAIRSALGEFRTGVDERV